jgi:hypothetical protein
MIHYRPHETWTTRADWRTQLPEDEDITCKPSLTCLCLYHKKVPIQLDPRPPSRIYSYMSSFI